MTQLQAIQDNFIHATKLELLNIVRNALLGETSAALHTPLPDLDGFIDSVGSLKRRTGEKRDPRVLAKLTTDLASYIFRNPGQRIEQIAKSMGVTTKELALPAKKLIASKSVKTRGQKRATVYLPASKGAR
jgi:hypothetical protein